MLEVRASRIWTRCCEVMRKTFATTPVGDEERIEILRNFVRHILARPDLREVVLEAWIDAASLRPSAQRRVEVEVTWRGDPVRLSRWSYPIHGFLTDVDVDAPLAQALARPDRRRLHVTVCREDRLGVLPERVSLYVAGDSEKQIEARFDALSTFEEAHREDEQDRRQFGKS